MNGPHWGHDTRRAVQGGEPAGADARPAADARPEADGRPPNAHPHAGQPLTGQPSTGWAPGRQSVLMDRVFGHDDITVVRHEVAERLTVAGLSDDRLHGFVLAVNEVITNVVLHAGGCGRLVLRVTDEAAYCTVADAGPGIPDHLRDAAEAPATSEVGGRGIWLAYQLCDEVTVDSGTDGTTIELRLELPRPDTPAGRVDRAAAPG